MTEANSTRIPPPSTLHAALAKDGYVLIRSLLSPTELSHLRNAAAATTRLARAGSWPHIRTLPKQFPPWPTTPDNGIWGVQHLLHPDLPYSTTFAASYFHAEILSIATALLLPDDDGAGDATSVAPDAFVLELYNLLVTPDDDFALRWHRDDIPPDATAEEEQRLLRGDGVLKGETKAHTHAQWNLALWDDESLIVVPGSQARARTERERTADPYAEHLEGMRVVSMQAGDVVFYDNNILHRGVYSKDKERATLHGSVGLAQGARARARNVLQHGIGEWVDRCDFSGLQGHWKGRALSDVAMGMKSRLKVMGGSDDIEFYSKDE